MMRALQLSELARVLGVDHCGEDVALSAVVTDSRKAVDGALFVALQGERFDAHDYLQDVEQAGAAALVVSRPVTSHLPCLLVEDTRDALASIAAFNRELYQGPLVGITGSTGKTTVKNLVAAVLGQRGETLATEGNLNNEIGVPLTLLRLAPEHRFAVVEMGAAKPGDIAPLCHQARPTVAVLLNAMPAHLERLGTVDEVANTKGAIYEGLRGEGTAIINADSPFAREWRARAGKASVLDFGLEKPAAISARTISSRGTSGISFIASTPQGDAPVALRLPGLHNVANALAAIAVGLACGLDLGEITAGLGKVRPVPGRMAVLSGVAGATLIDDSYNANPGSVRAAIDLLADCAGRRTLILGAMRELGEASAKMHRDLGLYARDAGLEQFWGVGPELEAAVAAFGEGGYYFADRDAAVEALPGSFDERDTVLIKGSRGAAMERILAAMVASPKEAQG